MRRSELPHLVAVVLLSGCLSAGPGDQAPALAELDGLPVYPFAFSDAPPAVRNLWAHSSAFLAVEPPTLNPALSLSETQEWAQRDLGSHLLARGVALRQIMREADALAASEEPADRVFSALCVGLVNERLAAELLALPLPHELESDGMLIDIYRDALEEVAAGPTERARDAYALCAERAAVSDEMRAWTDSCAGRGTTVGAALRRAKD